VAAALVIGAVAVAMAALWLAGGSARAMPKLVPSVCRGFAGFETADVEREGSGVLQVVFQHDCSARRVHIVHVINATSGVTGTRKAFMLGELQRATTALNLGSAGGRENIRVAIVTVNASDAVLSLPFTNDITRIISHRIESHRSAEGCLECGLIRARDAFREARDDVPRENPPAEFIMVHYPILEGDDGDEDPSSRAVMEIAEAMREEGIGFISANRSLASSGYHLGGGQSATLLFRNLGVNHSRTDLRGLELELDLVGLIPIPDSDHPPAEAAQGKLRWRFDYPPLSGVTLTLGAAAPPGTPITLTLRADLTDVRRHERELTFEHTIAPRILPPTPTPRPGEPTPTPTAPLPTRTPGPTPTLEGRRPPKPAYLPLARRDPCAVSVRPLDVILLVDTSHSMRGGEHDYLAAVAGAGQTLVDLLRSDADWLTPGARRMAVLSFTGDARVVLPLTDDWGAVERAVRSFESTSTSPLDTTRIDLGLRSALREVDSRRIPGHQPAIVLVTDGTVNEHYFDAALEAAYAAHAGGVMVFTVGLGRWYEARLLEGMAGSARRFAAARSEADLARIFASIAHELRCGRPVPPGE
jgi:Mg-chelatase subunit ChlD